MAYASAKVDALNEIIAVESKVPGEDIRVVVVTDFEKTSATALVEGVLDDEAGGAIAVFRALVSHPAGDTLDPILMTGSTVLVDDELIDRFITRAEEWVRSRNLEIRFADIIHDGYHEIQGKGKNWIPRYYSLMITEFFQEGLTRCIVGTRGLLGEGWDASRINVLIDMTTVTTRSNDTSSQSFLEELSYHQRIISRNPVLSLSLNLVISIMNYICEPDL
jgi:hypothetical protein